MSTQTRCALPLALFSLLPLLGCLAPDARADTATPGQVDTAPRPASGQIAAGAPQTQLERAQDAWLSSHRSSRMYLQLDKPLYQPGETVWFRASAVTLATLGPLGGQMGYTVQLVSPKGAVVAEKRVLAREGVAANDFELPEAAQGGEYTLRVTTDGGWVENRTFVVSAYEAPRFKKTLEFLKKAYGPGDTVAATIEVKRPTGEPFAGRELTGAASLDGVELPRVKVRTDAQGAAVVQVPLPAAVARGDGLLTVLVEDSGVTESITKRIPLVLSRLKLSFFPEGGDLVQGLPSRVYFAAQNLLDKPADVEGKVVDDHGQTMATFASVRDGMGRFSLTPATGRSYQVVITRPAGIAERYALPVAVEGGCTLSTLDDPRGAAPVVQVSVACAEARTVVLNAMLREQRLASATAQVEPGQPALVRLPLSRPDAPGVLRVTLFSETLEPLAERLVYRAWNRGLTVTVKPDRETYTPRGKVVLEVETRDASGRPVAADVAMSVVDDTVLSYADDKTGHLVSHLLLESELPDRVEEPNWYFKASEPKAAVALELLLGTRGWRRFEWQPVFAPPPPPSASVVSMAVGELEGALLDRMAPPRPAPPPLAEPPRRRREGLEKDAKKELAFAPARPVVAHQRQAPQVDDGLARAKAPGGPPPADRDLQLEPDEDFGGDKGKGRGRVVEWAKVRVFPAPSHAPGHDGPRTDFRETIYWNPSVKTDRHGKAKVTFFVSDAVTSFRVTSEALGGTDLVGRDEKVIQSKLPFFLDAKLPLEVAAGDRIDLPLTLKNEQSNALAVTFTSRLGDGLRLQGGPPAGSLTLPGASGKTVFLPLLVTGHSGAVEVSFSAQAQGLKDELTRRIQVVPVGFPRRQSASSTLVKSASHTLDLRGALPGSTSAKVTFYPSPMAAMVTGLDSILQEPSGCFEQASSSNYPNVMVMRYLQERKLAQPALLQRASKLLDSGYQKIASYETPTRGFEWFGGDPGHEALTAYGLMEFADMREVYGRVDADMVQRTVKWLHGRRDGKGGFTRNARALDSFGSASPEVTNAYIVFALSEAGDRDIATELRAVTEVAERSSDPYVIALAARANLDQDPAGRAGQGLVARLAALQRADGRFHGTTHSITVSGGHGLDVETTSLAVLALLSSKGHPAELARAIGWLQSARSDGGFGSTQATILALKALTAYDLASRRTEADGEITVRVNGSEVQRIKFEKGRQEPIVIDDLGRLLRDGANTVELQLAGGASLPYELSVAYTTADPASSPNVPLRVSTRLAKSSLKMGETVRAVAQLENTTDQGQPMTLVRLGIPGGLAPQTWQLKELVEKKQVDFYETRAREVVLYFRSLAPRARKEIAVDLVAVVPGEYTAPATSAYLYYTAEGKAWAPPVKVEVQRP